MNDLVGKTGLAELSIPSLKGCTSIINSKYTPVACTQRASHVVLKNMCGVHRMCGDNIKTKIVAVVTEIWLFLFVLIVLIVSCCITWCDLWFG